MERAVPSRPLRLDWGRRDERIRDQRVSRDRNDARSACARLALAPAGARDRLPQRQPARNDGRRRALQPAPQRTAAAAPFVGAGLDRPVGLPAGAGGWSDRAGNEHPRAAASPRALPAHCVEGVQAGHRRSRRGAAPGDARDLG